MWMERERSPNVDECANGVNCSELEVCSNTDGSYECVCQDGYSRNATSGLCEDMNECSDNTHNCDSGEHFVCSNTQGSFDCVCGPGFVEVNGTCADIDECVNSPCEPVEVCVNTIGSYQCGCDEGYALGDTGCHRVFGFSLFDNGKADRWKRFTAQWLEPFPYSGQIFAVEFAQIAFNGEKRVKFIVTRRDETNQELFHRVNEFPKQTIIGTGSTETVMYALDTPLEFSEGDTFAFQFWDGAIFKYKKLADAKNFKLTRKMGENPFDFTGDTSTAREYAFILHIQEDEA